VPGKSAGQPFKCPHDKGECVKTIVLLIILLLAFAGPLQAEIIHLKNGRQIEALQVWETGDQVLAKITESTTLSFPTDQVARIEKSPRRSGHSDGEFKVRGSITVRGEWIRPGSFGPIAR
jgi:hypothetical protein